MGRVLGLLAVIGLLTTILPATVVAAPPTRASGWQSGILCELPSDIGFVSVYVEVTEAGSFASMAIWTPEQDPFEDLPRIMSEQGSADFNGSILTAGFDLVFVEEPTDPEQPPLTEPAGTARVLAALTPSGPEQDFGSRDIRDGNRWLRIDETLQLYSVDGDLTIELLDGSGAVLGLESCGSSLYTVDVFGTDPNAWTYGGEQVFISCEWVTDLGTIQLLAVSEEGNQQGEVIVVLKDTVLVGLTSPELSETSFTAYGELVDVSQGMPVGTVTAAARLTPTLDRISDHTWSDPHRFTVVGSQLTVNGSLTLDLFGATTVLDINDPSCDAGSVRYQVLEKMPHR
ncbi:MAG TPA: hypothetical protein VHK28_11305 [Candidatus Limnocylindria bacterium]|nr:hypothetical protein [Candidatus Limnocylindria bacterium]